MKTKTFERRLLKTISFITLIAFLNCTMGCGYFYKVQTEKEISKQKITEINKPEKFIILQDGINAWHFDNLKFTGDMLTGSLDYYLGYHFNYLSPKKPEGANRYKKKSEPDVINEVHIYTTDTIPIDSKTASIPITSIQKIEIYNYDKKATTRSWVLGSLAIVGAGVIGSAIVLVVVAASSFGSGTKKSSSSSSSCPFVYVFDGNEYNFIGEAYAGATLPSLERDDYMPLPGIESDKGQYRIKMANELMEKQYTNLAELMVVNHQDNVSILPDKSGKIHSLQDLQSPLSAYDGNLDYLEQVKNKDNCVYLFNGDNENNDLSSLVLTFKKPHTSQVLKEAKLVINASNSLWVDYLFEKYSSLFGKHYNDFMEKQERAPSEKINQWILDQGLPLSVYYQTENGWEFVDYFNATGPLGSRDMLLPIDISKSDAEEIKIKLECGFNFWELDYAAIDFSDDIQFEVNYIQSTDAIDDKGNDVSEQIRKDDEIYVSQTKIGEELSLVYEAIPIPEKMKQSVFLHTKGYYTKIRDYQEKRQLLVLRKFKKPETFSAFSKEHYDEIYLEYFGESTHK